MAASYLQHAVCVRRNKREGKKLEIPGNLSINSVTYVSTTKKRKQSVNLSLNYNNYIARLVHKHDIVEMKYRISTPNERV